MRLMTDRRQPSSQGEAVRKADKTAEQAGIPIDYARPDAPRSLAPGHLSLEGIHGTILVPDHQAGFWRQWRAFVGPALLVSVGYMDPGNWGTDLQAGAQFKYGLLWVVALSPA